MQTDLHGKVALVTGSAHRVGKAIALELAKNGAAQVIHYHGSADQAEQTLAEVRALGVDAISVQADMGSPASIDNLFAAIRDHFGRLDILVNSASIFERADLLTVSYEDWQRTLSINLSAPFLCLQHAAQMMRATLNNERRGVIINISDQSGLKAAAAYPQHSVSKAGLLMLTKVAALSLAPDIRVNAVVPGLVLKPDDYSDTRWDQVAQQTPIKHPGSAEDVARAVVYLAREDYLTGTILTIDGGESVT